MRACWRAHAAAGGVRFSKPPHTRARALARALTHITHAYGNIAARACAHKTQAYINIGARLRTQHTRPCKHICRAAALARPASAQRPLPPPTPSLPRLSDGCRDAVPLPCAARRAWASLAATTPSARRAPGPERPIRQGCARACALGPASHARSVCGGGVPERGVCAATPSWMHVGGAARALAGVTVGPFGARWRRARERALLLGSPPGRGGETREARAAPARGAALVFRNHENVPQPRKWYGTWITGTLGMLCLFQPRHRTGYRRSAVASSSPCGVTWDAVPEQSTSALNHDLP